MGMIGSYYRVSENEIKEFTGSRDALYEKLPKERYTDVDKAWDGIFFVLTGKSSQDFDDVEGAMKWIVFPDNEMDSGYEGSPYFYSTVTETQEVANALNKITNEEFKSRYNSKALTENDVYPGIWDEGDDALDYLFDNYISLKNFYNQAAAENQAMIVSIG
ncbi:MAG: hypothetical protein K0S32_1427 [Bacteroidetes bacterium]|jgi:hypothetical protein|nr:hypothetical protein [Bacteroidota bacterium]